MKEPTKKELLKRIEALEEKIETMKLTVIHNHYHTHNPAPDPFPQVPTIPPPMWTGTPINCSEQLINQP